MRIRTVMTMITAEASEPYRDRPEAVLHVWLSPAFPVGGFAFSHGLEWLAHAGTVHDRASLQACLLELIQHGSVRNDLVLLACAWRAATRGQMAALREIAELAACLQPSAERRVETLAQGRAFHDCIEAAWPAGDGGDWPITHETDLAYPVSVGIASARHAIALLATLEAYGLAFIGALMSAGIRLSLIGQTDGQRILAHMRPTLAKVAFDASQGELADLGSACFVSDLATLHHETQYTRLFRS